MNPIKTYKGKGALAYKTHRSLLSIILTYLKLLVLTTQPGKFLGEFPDAVMFDFNEGKPQLSTGVIVEVINLGGSLGDPFLTIGVNDRMPGL